MTERRARRLADPGPLHLGGDLRIPRIIHRIWFGPMRQFHLDYGARTRALYEPLGWRVEEWGLDDLALPWMPADAIRDAVRRKRYAEASDIMRYAIIYHVGGLYVDSDAEPLADCTDALRGRDLLLVPESRTLLNNCYLGATPGNPMLAHMLDTLDVRRATVQGSVEYVTGPHWITEEWHTFADSGITWPLPPRDPWMPYTVFDVAFPQTGGPRSRVAHGADPIPVETLFAHHWNSERSKRGKRSQNWALNRRIV